MSPSRFMIATLVLAACAALPAVAAETEGHAAAKAPAAHEKESDRHEPAEGTQQHKMKVCNVEAHERGLKGDERRAFMSTCLRKS